MSSTPETPDEYIQFIIPSERQAAFSELRKVLLENLPVGFTEVITYGMISYVVPHSLYPDGYHRDPQQPLPFISIASQKNYIALYHMGIYAVPDLLNWFQSEYPKHSKKKLDMGKSCIRFKNIDEIPYGLIGQLAQKMTPLDWINIYNRSKPIK